MAEWTVERVDERFREAAITAHRTSRESGASAR